MFYIIFKRKRINALINKLKIFIILKENLFLLKFFFEFKLKILKNY